MFCDKIEIETYTIILLQENNCFVSNDQTSYQLRIKSNEISQTFFNDNHCQIKDNNKNDKQFECESCIENMTVYCEPFITIQNNNLTPIEISSIFIIILLSCICIIVSTIIIVFGIVYVRNKTSSLDSNDKSIPYVSVGNETELNDQNVLIDY